VQSLIDLVAGIGKLTDDDLQTALIATIEFDTRTAGETNDDVPLDLPTIRRQ
jgi:hypothetical protein